MKFFGILLISFSIIFFAELGDKTQIMILSFSTKNKIKNILLGISIGTLFSHGLAIIMGSKLGNISDTNFSFYLNLFTAISFILFGIVGFISMFFKKTSNNNTSKPNFVSKLKNIKINYIFIIAFCIFIGELGDKTLLSSIGLGIQYPNYKLALILGSLLGMTSSNLLAILLGKLLSFKCNSKILNIISNCLFIVFGIASLFMLCKNSAVFL